MVGSPKDTSVNKDVASKMKEKGKSYIAKGGGGIVISRGVWEWLWYIGNNPLPQPIPSSIQELPK